MRCFSNRHSSIDAFREGILAVAPDGLFARVGHSALADGVRLRVTACFRRGQRTINSSLRQASRACKLAYSMIAGQKAAAGPARPQAMRHLAVRLRRWSDGKRCDRPPCPLAHMIFHVPECGWTRSVMFHKVWKYVWISGCIRSGSAQSIRFGFVKVE